VGTAVSAGNTLGGYLLRFVMGQLQPGDRERIRKSFIAAIEWNHLSSEQRIATTKGGPKRQLRAIKKGSKKVGTRVKDRLKKAGRQDLDDAEISEREAIAAVADDLTEAWMEESAKSVLRSGSWISTLEECVRQTALKRAAEGHGSPAWKLVTCPGEHGSQTPTLKRWAAEITRQVVGYWSKDKRLSVLVAQLNAESGLGLQQAVATSSRQISKSLRRIAAAVTAMTLLGGGGIALLVLFLDKG
jgi:hypothetical protein